MNFRHFAVMAILATASAGQATGGTPGAASEAVQPRPVAGNDELTTLRGVVADLQRQVDDLRAASGDNWLTERRAAEVRELVSEVLADADVRASLLQSGAAAGWDNGFFIGSADGNYLLRIAGQIQVRAVLNMQDESPTDDNRFGFENRRTKVDFRGHAIDPSWTYYIEADVMRSGGAFTLGEFGWIQKDLGNGWQIRFGQQKPFFTREEMLSSRRLMAIERSQVHSQFSAGTSQGVQAAFTGDQWRFAGAIIDGAGMPNTVWSAEDTEFALTGRAEFLASGVWKDVEDNTSFRGSDPALLFGAGALYQKGEFGTPTPAELETLTFTADATWKLGGATVAGEFFYRDLSTDTGAADIDLDQYGLVIRGSVFVDEDLELYAMYEWGDIDVAGVDDLSVITVGFTKYYAKHALKWQNDIGYGLNPVMAPWAVDSAGWRVDSPDNDGQIVIRSQFQLLF